MVDESSACEKMTFKSIVNSGIDLEQLRMVLEFETATHLKNQVTVTKLIANDGCEEDCKKAVCDALACPNARVALNYDKSVAGQAKGGGHISPLVARNEELD